MWDQNLTVFIREQWTTGSNIIFRLGVHVDILEFEGVGKKTTDNVS